MFNFKKKRAEKLLAEFGTIKREVLMSFKITRYHLLTEKNDALQVLSDRTWQDLDMDEVFMFCDRTTSKVGQQWLYDALRTIPENDNQRQALDTLAGKFAQNRPLAEEALFELDALSNPAAYHLPSLFLGEHLEKPTWFWMIPILLTANVICGVATIFFPTFLVPLVFLLALSFGVHYWNKNNLDQYTASIPQLLILSRVAHDLRRNDGLKAEDDEKLAAAIAKLHKLRASASIFRMESGLQSEAGQLADYFLQIVKAFFLIEPIVLFKILKKLDALRPEMREVFDYVGRIDAALALSALRERVPYCCRPTIAADGKQLSTEGIYHPMIHDFVANSLQNDTRSVLLTGSNMSGKTTFIRTLGVNAVLSQTIGLAFAQTFTLSRLRVHSAIGMADDLFDDKSYYFAEVLTIKEMLEASRSHSGNLFLLDELFRGTNTVERIAAGKAVLDYLDRGENLVVVSTHDLELAGHLKDCYDLYHFAEVIENDRITFDYKLKPGNLTTTNAIRILTLNGYPAEVVEEALRLISPPRTS